MYQYKPIKPISMPRKNLKHAYKHFADMQLSADQFYKDLEKLVAEYQYPDIQVYRQFLRPAGLFDEKREYLVFMRGNYRFYVCAAPYGKSYFISWWFQFAQNPIVAWLFRSPIISFLFEDDETTLFKQDTQLMFENSINSLISEYTATIQPQHGKRVLISNN